MGLLDRLRGPDRGGDADDTHRASENADGTVDSITSRGLTSEEEAVLDAARAGYAERQIDPGDLTTVAAAYERALAERRDEGTASECVTVVATAIGDHLTGHGFRWVVSTDPFGSDLAVEPPRHPVPVVPHTLVAVRWMKRESGWVEQVVEHLARAGTR